MPSIEDPAEQTQERWAHGTWSGTVQARLVRALDLSPETVESWGSLHQRALEQNPFFEPACVIPAARHLPHGDRIQVLLAEANGTVLGCMPLLRLPRWHWSRRGTLTTDVRRLTWLGTPLLDRARADEAMTAMLAFLRGHRRRSGDHMLAIERIHTRGPVDGVVRAAAAALRLPLVVGETYERPVYLQLPTGSDGEDPAPMPRHSKLPARRRKLAARLGPVEVLERSSDPTAVDELIELEAKGYKGREGVSLSSFPGETEWFTEMCAAFAAEGRLVFPCLTAGGKVVALNTIVTAADETFACVGTYDEEFRAYSPGTLLRNDTMYLLSRAGFRSIDWCTYRISEEIGETFPDRIEIGVVLVGLGSPVERLLLGALPAARRTRFWGRAHLARLRRQRT